MNRISTLLLTLGICLASVGLPMRASCAPAINTAVKGTVVYWSEVNRPFVAANTELIKRFNQIYPNVTIDYQQFPWDALLQKMQTSYAARSESDVQEIFGTWAIEYTKNGLFAEMPADQSAMIKANYFEGPLGGYLYKGKVYGVPREFNIENGGVLYYPADLKAVGYNTFPKTFADLIDCAKKLTKYDSSGEITHSGFEFLTSDSETFFFLSLILQQGASYWDKDGAHVKFMTPEGQKAFQTMVDFVAKYKLTSYKHKGTEGTSDVFFKGRASMCLKGPYDIPYGLNEYKLTNFDYGSMPSFTGTSKAFAAESGWGEVVSNRNKNKPGVMEFFKFVTTTENNEYWNTTSFTIPADKRILKSESYKAFVAKNPMLKVSLDVLPYGKDIGPFQNNDEFKDLVKKFFIKAIDGTMGAMDALRSLETETNEMIDGHLSS